jgi:hypothetical protein
VSTIDIEKKARLHFSEREGGRGKRSDDGSWPSTSAQWVERVAGWERQRGEQKRTEGPQEDADSFHMRIVPPGAGEGADGRPAWCDFSSGYLHQSFRCKVLHTDNASMRGQDIGASPIIQTPRIVQSAFLE